MSPEISSARCHNKQFLVILDNDQGGKDALKHYKKDFKIIKIVEKIKSIAEISQRDEIKTIQINPIQDFLLEDDKKLLLKLANFKTDEVSKVLVTNALISLNESIMFNKKEKATLIEQLQKSLSADAKTNIATIITNISAYFS